MPSIKRLSTSPRYILGFHGCTLESQKKIYKTQSFVVSEKDYEWLGTGVYFWEDNYQRAKEWALQVLQREDVRDTEPGLVCAVIEITENWIDFLDVVHINELKKAYKKIEVLPKGDRPKNEAGKRKLDCAVINLMVQDFKDSGKDVDGIRGVFIDGEPVYPTANFYKKSHIQVAVINPECIKELFRLKDLEKICLRYNMTYYAKEEA